jgi:hypothetical protein
MNVSSLIAALQTHAPNREVKLRIKGRDVDAEAVRCWRYSAEDIIYIIGDE